ncbi:hypothetical protein BsWGS_22012 [Bradybaena similaris]
MRKYDTQNKHLHTCCYNGPRLVLERQTKPYSNSNLILCINNMFGMRESTNYASSRRTLPFPKHQPSMERSSG